jgi:hypothetical protein
VHSNLETYLILFLLFHAFSLYRGPIELPPPLMREMHRAVGRVCIFAGQRLDGACVLSAYDTARDDDTRGSVSKDGDGNDATTGDASTAAVARDVRWTKRVTSVERDMCERLEKSVRVAIAAHIDRLNIRSGYCIPASGADLVFAEVMIAKGVDLHIILPFASASFCDHCVDYGDASLWRLRQRFEAVCAAAADVTYVEEKAATHTVSSLHLCVSFV